MTAMKIAISKSPLRSLILTGRSLEPTTAGERPFWHLARCGLRSPTMGRRHGCDGLRILFVIAFFVLACAHPAAAQQQVNIGLLAPFTGLWAEQGRLMRIGAEMALEDINS